MLFLGAALLAVAAVVATPATPAQHDAPVERVEQSPQEQYVPAVINARAQVFGHRDHDEVYRRLQVHTERYDTAPSSWSAPSSPNVSSTDSESSQTRSSLVMLPSALDPLGRKIRRVTTDVIDDDEQLVLVKRRAGAANAIALRGHAPHQQSALTSAVDSGKRTRSQCARRDRADAAVAPADFEYLKVLGVGAWGKVVLVRDRRDAALYAMKVISKRSVREQNLAAQILSERDVLGGTHHHALVHLHWAFQTKTSLFFVMEYCPGGELSAHLQHAERFSEDVARFYAAELVLALEHLHRHGVIYRDLKPENVLLTASGHAKLVDFGISKFGITEATAGATTMCGSYEYLAPEVFLSKEYGTAVDWWSFGVVLYELLTGLPPWYSPNPHTMRKRVLTKTLTVPSFVSPHARDLLRQLMQRDPARRLGSRDGSTDIKRHAFFRDVDWQLMAFGEVAPPIQPCRSLHSIESASNFDVKFTRLSLSSVDAPSSSNSSSSSNNSASDDFTGFNFEAPEAPHIEYSYTRDKSSGARRSAGMCA